MDDRTLLKAEFGGGYVVNQRERYSERRKGRSPGKAQPEFLGSTWCIRGQASTYLIRFDQVAGAARLFHGVAKRLKERNGVPWWSRAPVIQRQQASWRRNGQEQLSDGLVEGWIVKGLVMNEGSQDMQELVFFAPQAESARTVCFTSSTRFTCFCTSCSFSAK